MITFIPTPIGNLSDISYRSIDSLRLADIILCEDTRVTKKLLNLLSLKLDITFPIQDFKSVHSHNEKEFLTPQNKELLTTKNVVYVSDAGMPCISDPGALLVNFCIENDIKYDVLPGANALLTAYAMSGFEQKEFNFFGFLPHKGKDRQHKLESILENRFNTILYESPHRLLKLLEQLVVLAPNRVLFIVKELTKMYQTSYKGTVAQLYEKLKNADIRGEWVVIIKNDSISDGEAITVKDLSSLDIAPKQKAKLISKLTGQSVKEIYNTLV